MARSDPIVDTSIAAARARLSDGMAIAAMMPMMVTTSRSSTSVKPAFGRRLEAGV
jgi:hypothetical protein